MGALAALAHYYARIEPRLSRPRIGIPDETGRMCRRCGCDVASCREWGCIPQDTMQTGTSLTGPNDTRGAETHYDPGGHR